MALTNIAFSDLITFTRASTGTYTDSVGVLQTAAIDTPRFDYSPTTLAAQGFLVEEARTNSIRNSTGVGVVAGSPGTPPNNWSITNPLDGVTPEIIGTGTQNGIAYIDIRYQGTSGTAPITTAVRFESDTQVAALNAQVWTSSAYIAVIGGSSTNILSLALRTRFNSAAGANLTTTDVSISAATSALSRFAVTGTATDATTAYVNTTIVTSFTDSAPIDITLRIGLPQLELGSGASSAIPTSTVAVTRATDLQKINTLSPWYNPSEGTIFAQSIVSSINAGNTNTGVTSFDDNTANNRIQLRHTSPSNNLTEVVVTSGVVQTTGVASLSNTWPFGVMRKAVFAFKANDFRGAISGTLTAADPTGTIPTVTQLQLGNGLAITALSGYLQRITYYPRRLTDAELQTLTT
jgi:hypothetical protein